jgi:hypothetical protein
LVAILHLDGERPVAETDARGPDITELLEVERRIPRILLEVRDA